MSDTIFGSPSANAMQAYHRGLDDLSDMIFIPYDQQIPDFTQKSPAPMQPYLSFDEDYNSANIQDLQLQLYQELRNQVMWQDMRGDMSFNSSHPEYESISADSSANTPTFDQSMSSFLEPRPMSSMSSSVESTTATATANANFASVPEPEYVASRPKPKAKSKPKKHKRKHVMPRSKKGCWICRIKHLKCDEKRPHCEACRRFGIECDFSEERPAYVVDNELRKQKLFEITRKRRAKTEA